MGSPSITSSDDETSRRPAFRLEDTDQLLKAVRDTMNLEDPKEGKSVEDRMFEGLETKRKSVFPIHKNIWGLIRREWKHPDKGVYIPKTLKRKYPFDDQETVTWGKSPKLDVPISKVSRRSSLPFEDAGSLHDPLDKKLDMFLCRTREAAAIELKTNIASTCVGRSLMVWLNQLEEHIQDKTPRETLVSSLPTLKKAAAFSADASTDAIKLSAILANSARWALWIKNWLGDIGSKNRLCSIPCEGEFLFGSVLDDLLEKAGDKEKGSPSNYPGRQSRFFRGSGGSSQNRKRRQEGNRFRGSKKSRGFLFNKPSGSFRRSGPQ